MLINEKPHKGLTLGLTDNFAKRQIWKQIAKEQNGEFKVKFDSGRSLEIHNIKIPYKKWNIEISVSDTRPLKFQVNFSSLQNFSLNITKQDFIEKFLKLFSRTATKVGWKEFDNRYIISSDRAGLIKKIFTRPIQENILKTDLYSISFRTTSKSKKAELISLIHRETGNKKMMDELIKMFKMIMDNLEKLKIIE